jgi:hypothetical protein
MLKPKLIQLLIYQFPILLFAQIGSSHFFGARNESLANAVTADDSSNAVFHNPAGLSTVKNAVLISTFQKPYGLKDLQSGALACIIPTHSNVFGISLNYTGITQYSEQNIGLAYSKKFFPKLSAGLRLNGNIVNAREYGNHFSFTFDMGINALIFKDLNIGFYIENPISRPISEGERTPSVFRLGAVYRISEKVKTLIDIEKNILYAPSYKMGLEYVASPNIALRGGFSTQPVQMSFGIGFHWLKNWIIDCALSSHTVLGLTPAASLLYVFKKNT